MERHTQINVWYFILATLAVVWIRDIWVSSQHIEQISYSDFQQALEEGRIESAPTSEGRVSSEETNHSIDEAVRGIVNGAFDRAIELLTARRSTLEAGALTLLQQETLEQSDLEALQTALPIAAAVDSPTDGSLASRRPV